MFFPEHLETMEDSYRKHYFAVDKRQSLYSMGYLQVANLSFVFSDIYFFRESPSFWPVLMIRLILFLAPLALWLVIRKIEIPAQLDLANLGFSFLMVSLVPLISLYRPEMMVANIGIDGLVILGFYLMIPNRLRFRILPAVAYTAFLLWSLITDHHGIPAVNMNSVFLVLFFCNLMGLFVSNQFQFYRRKRYRAYARLLDFQNELETLANQDPLTGLANRRRFLELGETEWQRFKRYQRPFSVLLIDIDHFKRINDHFGHFGGDAALVAFADQVQGWLRSGDVLARVGGEEFGLILPETEQAAASKIAQRLGQLVRAMRVVSERGKISFSISIGVAEALPSDGELHEVIVRADRALYQAKESGRDKVCVA